MKIEKFVDSILSDLKFNKKIKKDLKLQFIDHLDMLKKQYLDDGKNEEDALELAIKDFGDGSLIINEFYNPMEKSNNFSDLFSKVAFSVYCIFLALVLFNPIRPTAQWVATARQGGGYWGVTINILPFNNLIHYTSSSLEYQYSNILIMYIKHLLLFIPFGFLFQMVFYKGKKFKRFIFLILIISFLIEIIRLIFPLGVSDIDHIILHIIGSIIGLYIYLALTNVKFILHYKHK